MPGLNLQIIQRLKEMRELMIILANIERGLVIDTFTFPGEDMLAALKLDLPFQDDVMKAVRKMSISQRGELMKLFNTDREIALNLISFVDVMLSLFQETDSTIDGSVLAFYEQREWRLVHHMREGMVWYCLGNQPYFRDPYAELRRRQIYQLRSDLSHITGQQADNSYFDYCWLLESVDGVAIADFLSTVIVPNRIFSFARQILREVGSHAQVIASEDLGYH